MVLKKSLFLLFVIFFISENRSTDLWDKKAVKFSLLGLTILPQFLLDKVDKIKKDTRLKNILRGYFGFVSALVLYNLSAVKTPWVLSLGMKRGLNG